MGCGCGKKIARNNKKKKKATSKKAGSLIRKRRMSKLISVPGRSVKKKKITSK
jgi:hypothetical protein